MDFLEMNMEGIQVHLIMEFLETNMGGRQVHLDNLNI